MHPVAAALVGGNGNVKPSKNVMFSARDLALWYDIDSGGCAACLRADAIGTNVLHLVTQYFLGKQLDQFPSRRQ